MTFLPNSAKTFLQHTPSVPAHYILALKIWFPQETLTAGLDLLQKKKVRFFSFQRGFAGLILDNNTHVSLQMAGAKGKHRFVFRDGSCSQCGWQQGGANCTHVAALALLCLRQQDGKLQTLAELFAQNPWFTIGRYLHEQTNMRNTITLQLWQQDNGWLLHGASDNGLTLKLHLSVEALNELTSLFSILRKISPSSSSQNKHSTDHQTLLDNITKFAATKNEISLNNNGLQSKQQKLDASLWIHLAKLLFLHLPAEKLKVETDQNGIYTLYYGEKNDSSFELNLPRNHTWELLNNLSLPDIPDTTAKAEQFSKVFFAPDNTDMQVDHYCRLQDGRKYRLADIEKNCYGTRYQIDNTIFTLQTIPPVERLNKTPQGKQLSLFAVPNDNKTNNKYGFTIKENDVTDFIKENHEKLHRKRHEVSPEILNMKVVSMPLELILDEYEEDNDWCYLAGWYGMGNQKISLETLLAAADEGRTLLPGQTWLDLKDSPLSWFHELGSNRILEQDGRIKMKRGEFLALSAQIGAITNHSKQQSGTLAAFLQSGDTSKQLKTQPTKHLRSYQKHGCNWLYQLQHYQLGGILADDMGLGKTHQALALIDLLTAQKNRFLIVCPAAVLYHWPEKQKQFFPQLSLSVYHGSKRDLTTSLNSDIIVTSYGVLRQDAEYLAEYNFKLLIFDEMHTLKNRKTATYAAVSLLKADTIIGLTGTPIENSVQELETLLSICLPEIFTAAPIVRQFKYAKNREQRQQLQRLVAPFLLRRTRKQVLKELPECSEDIRTCELSTDQIEAYRQATDNVQEMVDELLEDENSSDFISILTTITRLKQICNHLCQLELCTDYKRYKSGKWDEFTRLIGQCMDSGLKVVVFSQFTAMLDIIETWLTDETIDFVDIRGSVAPKERSKRITRFNTDKTCKICCASLLAGGTGIDLTGAQVVIHYDRWWNPAKEEQATARVHRMGQKHPVQVYKLVTAGTLEEKIHLLIEKKRALATDLVVEDDGSILKTLSRKDLAGLFRY